MTQAVLVIHGGAGAISRAKTTPAIVQEYRSALQATLARGSAILADGGSALDAVCEAVRLLEECALFNAGHGAVFTSDGRHELDRSEEHTSELQSLMRISYAVFCLKKKKKTHKEQE